MVYYLNTSAKKMSMQNVFSGNNLLASVGIPVLVALVFVVVVTWKKPEKFTKFDSDGKRVVDWKKTLMWAFLLLAISFALTFAIMKYGMSD